MRCLYSKVRVLASRVGDDGLECFTLIERTNSTGVAPMSLSGINGMIELVGGVLIVLGLFTRPVAFILAGDESVRAHLTAGLDYQDRLVRFIENHDEPRAAATFSAPKEHAAAIAGVRRGARSGLRPWARPVFPALT